jgi:hypothetical protein
MNMRREVCELANEIAKKRGGKPHEYMGEAWETIRQRKGQDIRRKPIKLDKKPKRHEFKFDLDDEDDDDEFDTEFGHIGRRDFSRSPKRGSFAGRKMKEVARKSLRSTADSLNFTKAPADRPSAISGIFGGTFKKEADPIPKIPDSIKRMFKPW